MNSERKVPEIQVGILSGEEIFFTLNGPFQTTGLDSTIEGRWRATCSDNKIWVENYSRKVEGIGEQIFSPANEKTASFTVHSVIIGVNFHWERREDQVFRGKLRLIIEDNKITVVNILSVEEYLVSVISSEMSATSSEELLKAHAVISRGWLLAQIYKRGTLRKETEEYNTCFRTGDEIVRWYDREDHNNYDVCADDHCQRYQGITRASTPAVEKAIYETSGEVLTFAGDICDTRYYKCCGGVSELFENVWEPVNHPYLRSIADNNRMPEGYDINLKDENNAKLWITGNPEAFCNTTDKKVLSQVLNDYDQETNDFFRWKVTYSQADLSDLIRARTGIDFGMVTDLIPLERGASGRIKRLKIEGSEKLLIIGKELEIRKTLSLTHLYSSCFFVEKRNHKSNILFTLNGAGWGHGVGLCQIGAAVMGSKGYKYQEILMHYFRDTLLERRY
jgi:stage II sporulation protein D